MMLKQGNATGIDAIVMGASWGGVSASIRVLERLPENFPVAILLVQHQRNESISRLVPVLQRHVDMPVLTPDDKQVIESGKVYVAPPGYHFLVDIGKTVNYSLATPVHFCRPAIDELFYSAGHIFGNRLIGVLLTGANEDGAAGLKYIRERGGITLVQSPDTAEAPAMPQAAIDLDAAMETLPLNNITKFLLEKVAGIVDE